MKKLTIAIYLVFAVMLAGCSSAPEKAAESPSTSTQVVTTLFDTNTIRIELEGADTRVYDLVGGAEYDFTTTRTIRTTPLTLEERQSRALGRTVTDTETMRIELAGGLIVVHDLTAEITYYVNR